MIYAPILFNLSSYYHNYCIENVADYISLHKTVNNVSRNIVTAVLVLMNKRKGYWAEEKERNRDRQRSVSGAWATRELIHESAEANSIRAS